VIASNSRKKIGPGFRLTCTLPKEVEVLAIDGPTTGHLKGNKVAFDPLQKMDARANAIYQLTIRAKMKGAATVEYRLESLVECEPIIEKDSFVVH
jgi:hypothetical protein